MVRIALLGTVPSPGHVQKVVHFIHELAKRETQISLDSGLRAALCAEGKEIEAITVFEDRVPEETDCVVCFGGDGTLLRSVHRMPSLSIPILAINSGHLGFLTDIDCEEALHYIERLFEANPCVEERSLLEVTDGASFFTTALNEIAILKRETASMISIETYIDGHYLADYAADGLVIATPSGSTAYSLSLGGPITYPSCPVILLTPIAPHSLNMRPLAVPDNISIELKVKSRSSTYMVAADGEASVFPTETSLVIRKHDDTLKLIRLSSRSFSETIRNKLLWGKNLR